jgi:hypothetical protein
VGAVGAADLVLPRGQDAAGVAMLSPAVQLVSAAITTGIGAVLFVLGRRWQRPG